MDLIASHQASADQKNRDGSCRTAGAERNNCAACQDKDKSLGSAKTGDGRYPASSGHFRLQTTFDRLKRAFIPYTERHVYIGRVRYLDYEREFIPAGNILAPFLYKRKSFSHENEVRAVMPCRRLLKNEEHGKHIKTPILLRLRQNVYTDKVQLLLTRIPNSAIYVSPWRPG
jgi:hypothetical protein